MTAGTTTRCRVDLLVESGDIVVSNWTLTGTHSGGPYYDVPPSGERVTINGTGILRFRDGKIVEHWGGPHCMNGIGLSTVVADHGQATNAASPSFPSRATRGYRRNEPWQRVRAVAAAQAAFALAMMALCGALFAVVRRVPRDLLFSDWVRNTPHLRRWS